MRQIYCRHAVRCCFHQQIYTEQSEDKLQSWVQIASDSQEFSSAVEFQHKSFHAEKYHVPSPCFP